MFRFIESIKLLDGKFHRLEFHQRRINRIFEEFFPNDKPIILLEIIENQHFPIDGFFKFRLVFGKEVENVEFIPYQLPRIQSLKIISIDIPVTFYKSGDREKINQAVSQKDVYDDVLFVKNGKITDTSYCNVAFFDGSQWITPKTPLIYGTQRDFLLKEKKMIEKEIFIGDVSLYQSICLFNAMIEFGEIIFPCSNIYF